MNKALILIRGLPGSGKTTLAKILSGDVYPIYAEDDYYQEENGSYKWTSEKEIIAKRKCLENTSIALASGHNMVFVTNVFLTQEDLEPYLYLAKELKYRCHVLIAQNTHGSESIHNVAPKDFVEMKKKFEVVL